MAEQQQTSGEVETSNSSSGNGGNRRRPPAEDEDPINLGPNVDTDSLVSSMAVYNAHFSDAGGSSWLTSALIVMNACLGAGILNLPSAFAQAGGLVAANILNLLVMLLSMGGIVLLGWASDRAKADNYQDTMSGVCGRRLGQLCACLVAVYTYCTCITFLIVIGDQFDRLLYDKVGLAFCDHWYYDRRLLVPLCSTGIILPLCFFKNIDSLKYVSGFATLSVVYLVGLTVAAYLTADTSKVHVVTSPQTWTQVLVAVPSICFGYQCHVSAVPVYSCVRPRRLSQFMRTCGLAFAICLVTYAAVGSFGLLAFGDDVNADLLSSMSTENWWFAFGYIFFAVKIFLTYPIVQFCGRLSIMSLWTDVFGELPDEYRFRVIISGGWFVSSLVFAVFAPSMATVIDFLGFLAVAFIFIYPGMCWLQLELSPTPTGDSAGGQKKVYSVRVLLACAFVAFGAFLLGLTFTQTVQQAFDWDLPPRHHTHGHPLCPVLKHYLALNQTLPPTYARLVASGIVGGK